MCLLTFFPADVQPNVDALHNGSITNDDGHGWAIAAGDQLLWGKGMNAVDVIEQFAIARSKNPHGPAIFHSRYTTHGETNVENCHPFFVGGDERTVLAHNGILPSNVQPRKKDKRSDTRIAAEWYIPRVLGSPRYRRNRLKVEKWMGGYNKIAILTVNPRYKEQAYLLNEAAGIWDDGIWYSNDAYLPWRYSYTPPCAPKGARRPFWWEDEDEKVDVDLAYPLAECRICDAIIHADEDVCPYCNCCLDCNQDERECFCYTPMALERMRQDEKEELLAESC